MSKQSQKEGDIRSENPLYQLCVFDDRRGTEEGNEDDKVLVAWPSTRASSELASVVGLAQAMISFMSNFEPVRSDDRAAGCSPPSESGMGEQLE